METLAFYNDSLNLNIFDSLKNSSINNGFKRTEKYNTKLYYLWKYYPYNKYPNLEGIDDDNRKLIWDFKDGINTSHIAELISDALINLYDGKQNNPPKTLCVIPASTANKTKNRFQSFCRKVSYATGILNGYELLSNHIERNCIHIDNNRKINHADYIRFGDVRNKEIILFDDVLTTGRSFKNISAALMQKQAKSVTGVFLACTTYFE